NSGNKFIEAYLKNNPKAKKTTSGLVYEVMKEGTGKNPTATDTVEVHYHGSLTNGLVFDSSVERNKKISFPLNRVVKGWTEGLQLIKEGGKIKLIIPSDLAYGNAGAPPTIPGGATLIFEVELFKVNP
ncbi:MAG: FKBP-type peptidyl-prolyl cis-trans isomerase, partial [Gammaproteobacteria bacterium]|nr:FKBP-type peptidyl-prolyl cis-trans isomerase [Gammaproteobacteria bacterium]